MAVFGSSVLIGDDRSFRDVVFILDESFSESVEAWQAIRMTDDHFEKLTDRQRSFLRLVYDHRDTKEIARITGEPSLAAIDKQISIASAKLGATSRVEAARLLHEHEAGIRPSEVRPSEIVRPSFLPLSIPLPTASRPTNTMDWRRVLAWGVIIAIVAPLLLTAAATLLVAVAQLVASIRP